MNRKQRRALKSGKEKTYVLKKSDIDNYKNAATETIFYTMVSIGCLTIQKHFKKLIKIEVDGKSRVQRFFDLYAETYQEWSSGKITDLEIEKFMMDVVGVSRR